MKHFNPAFNPTFVAVGPCKYCGKPVDRFGGHQFMIGLRLCAEDDGSAEGRMSGVIWVNALGWLLAGHFFGRYLSMRRRLKAIEHDIALVKLFVSTGGLP